MKSFDENGGEQQLRRRNRKAKLARIMRSVPQTLAVDLLTLTVCCRYAESLLKNPRVKKYLMKHYPEELSDLEMLLAEFHGSEH